MMLRGVAVTSFKPFRSRVLKDCGLLSARLNITDKSKKLDLKQILPEVAQNPTALPWSNQSIKAIKRQITEAALSVDEYFENLIKGYPSSTQNLLREMYYLEKNIVVDEADTDTGTHQDNFIYANWSARLSTKYDAKEATLKDEILYSAIITHHISRSILLKKLNLIHEVAVHLGQYDQMSQIFGVYNFFLEYQKDSHDFKILTEMSAAVAEKQVLRLIPKLALEADIRLNIKNKDIQSLVLKDYLNRKSRSMSNAIELVHRGNGDGVSIEHIQWFISHCKK